MSWAHNEDKMMYQTISHNIMYILAMRMKVILPSCVNSIFDS